MITCHFENNILKPCIAMECALRSIQLSGIGFSVVHVINLQTMQERDAGIAFKFTKKSIVDWKNFKGPSLMCRVCPFCEKPILKEKP